LSPRIVQVHNLSKSEIGFDLISGDLKKKLGQYLCMERQKAFMLLEIRIQTQATLVLIGFLMELHGQDIQMDDSLMDVTKLITLVCFVALDLHS
jgi:hypothetical protein